MAWRYRAEGPGIGRCVQAVPFHSQVWPLALPVLPPKRTQTLRTSSKAMAAWMRGDGPVVARRDQFAPSNSQVSPLEPPLKPPKSTVTPRAESYAIACWLRASGAWEDGSHEKQGCAVARDPPAAAATRKQSADSTARRVLKNTRSEER